MMKKFGFTLAEVLITLGVIGVVAALTTPALVATGRNEQNAAKLAVTVSNLENAFANAISREGVDTIFQTTIWNAVGDGWLDGANGTEAQRALFVGELGKYMNTNGFKNTTMGAFYADNHVEIHGMNNNFSRGDAIPMENIAALFPILMKNGAVIFIRAVPSGTWSNDQDAARVAGSAYYDTAADVFIDVNGPAEPNVVGRDVFGFYLGQNGILYPTGGVDVSITDHINEANPRIYVWSNAEVAGWRCLQGTVDNYGWGCTARLIEENYKMNY